MSTRRDNQAEPRKVSLTEAARTVQSGLLKMDQGRAAQFAGLAKLRQVKGASLAREQTRLASAPGVEREPAAEIEGKLGANEMLLGQIERFSAASRDAAPQPEAGAWTVHGHVRTADLKPAPGLTVALYSKDGEWQRAFGHDCTDENGHFLLRIQLATNSTGSAAKLAASVAQWFLRVTDDKRALLTVDTVGLPPRPGAVDYREIILREGVCASPSADDGPQPEPPAGGGKKTRFLGNSGNREVHDLQNAKKNCQVDEIAADRRVFFRTAGDAVKAGYDYCAYCFGKTKSKR